MLVYKSLENHKHDTITTGFEQNHVRTLPEELLQDLLQACYKSVHLVKQT